MKYAEIVRNGVYIGKDGARRKVLRVGPKYWPKSVERTRPTDKGVKFNTKDGPGRETLARFARWAQERVK